MKLTILPDGRLATEKFAAATEEERAAKSNGCGPDGWLASLVPDNVFGADFSPACDVHDWMYQEARTPYERHVADRVLLYNLLVSIDTIGSLTEAARDARIRGAFAFYRAVDDLGMEFWWRNKGTI